ncbi:hypothetical protein P3541_25635, partial [Vibrio parahaemolyticus]|nr:hypothetical protein [Vibrio parahaemolyticus]
MASLDTYIALLSTFNDKRRYIMEHLIFHPHKTLFSAMLLGAAALYGPTALAQDPGIQSVCMEDQYGKSLNC